MSLLEQLIRQLGTVELDPKDLVLVVDGEPVTAKHSISIAVETKPPVDQPREPDVEQEEWEWKLALARARAATERETLSCVRRPPRSARGTEPPVSEQPHVTREPVTLTPRRRARIVKRPRPRTSTRSHLVPPPLPPPLPPPPDDE